MSNKGLKPDSFVPHRGRGGRPPIRSIGIQTYPSNVPGLLNLKHIQTESESPVFSVNNNATQTEQIVEKEIQTHDIYTETDKMTEIQRRIGEAVMSLSVDDFPKIITEKYMRDSGVELVQQINHFISVMKEKLGNDSRYTIFHHVNQSLAAISGFHRTTVAAISSGSHVEPLTKKPRLCMMTKKEKCLKIASRLTIHERFLIRKRIDEIWKEKKQLVLDDLYKWAKAKINFHYSLTYFRFVISGLGYCFRNNHRLTSVEDRPDVAKKRQAYLDVKQKMDQANVMYFAYDETWAHDGMASKRCWQNKSSNEYRRARMVNNEHPISGPVKGKHRGKRGIVLCILTPSGILPGSAEFIVSGTNPDDQYADYHKEMNSGNCENYFRKQVPVVAATAAANGKQAVIIIDNAPYHNRTITKPPTTASKKGDICQWLESYGVRVPPKATRPELLEISRNYVEMNGGKEEFTLYEIDEWARNSHNVIILRLPPFHCFWNPIEFLWSQLKSYLTRVRTADDSLVIVRQRTLKFLNEFNGDSASALFEHCRHDEEEVREQVREREQLVEVDSNLLYDVDEEGNLVNIHLEESEDDLLAGIIYSEGEYSDNDDIDVI